MKGKGWKLRRTPELLLGSSRETLEILFFSYRKKNAGAILLFCCGVQSAPTKVPTSTAAAGRPTAGGGEGGG